ncbi:MAG: hypothetical protein LBD14_04990, partial [Puniceicoccales bacterium]|nr:hypothetical protein [Puniceicoccales bacterium]
MSSSCQDKFSMRHEPARTKPTLEKLVVAARKKTPCFGAHRLVEAFDLPVDLHVQMPASFSASWQCL